MNRYRNLTPIEIGRLEANHCCCDDWSKVWVHLNFHPEFVQYVQFSGEIKLGIFEKSFTFSDGFSKHSGLFHVTLHNCEVGDNTLVENVHSYISNYRIGSDCFIQNVDSITANKDARFGNNVEVGVLDESGGRTVPLFNQLSAQMAYIITCYRYNAQLILRLGEIIERYRETQVPDKGLIEDGVKIINAGEIKDVIIGKYCRIRGAARLFNGTISSERSASTFIGKNVIAEDFLITEGADIEDGVCLKNCFVGQSSHLKRGYSATDSLFFSNCHLENGESCATFGGPFTVSHHKPTLLIGGMFSFMNAGSGTNQSNHLYKLGPIHQGITERGLKTSSNCYLMWPAHIGAFSFVMGKHYDHPDTSIFPYSYLMEEGETSILIPGIALKYISLMRDEKKWFERDKRTASKFLDYLHSNVFSPFTMQKVFSAIGILKNLQVNVTSELYQYMGCTIKYTSIVKGIHLYELAINKYLGDVFLNGLDEKEVSSWTEIKTLVTSYAGQDSGNWVDLVGLLAPKNRIDDLMNQIVDGSLQSVREIDSYVANLHGSYREFEFSWVVGKLKSNLGWSASLKPEQFSRFVDRWEEASKSLYEMMLQDVQKEYSPAMTVGFGLDNPLEKDADVLAVRGRWEDNSITQSIQNQIRQVAETALRWKTAFKQ